ncbi:hypothetical protein BC829DRAFT_79053 [Chytridium lagenaria]|nr:hypothetical protein BC829DRAFT_79053 [Chytridium lagenaria]
MADFAEDEEDEEVEEVKSVRPKKAGGKVPANFVEEDEEMDEDDDEQDFGEDFGDDGMDDDEDDDDMPSEEDLNGGEDDEEEDEEDEEMDEEANLSKLKAELEGVSFDHLLKVQEQIGLKKFKQLQSGSGVDQERSSAPRTKKEKKTKVKAPIEKRKKQACPSRDFC